MTKSETEKEANKNTPRPMGQSEAAFDVHKEAIEMFLTRAPEIAYKLGVSPIERDPINKMLIAHIELALRDAKLLEERLKDNAIHWKY